MITATPEGQRASTAPTSLSPAAALRAQLSKGFVVAVGTADTLAAVIAREAGFSCLYLSGFAFEAIELGEPDMGLSTNVELARHAGNIVDKTGLPLICDIDTGFGGVNNVWRTVRMLERAGVAGVQIEDQANPKRCPALGGRRLADVEEATSRIRAAVEARADPNFVVIARTDAEIQSRAEVARRCRAYFAAGADAVMPLVMGFADGQGKPGPRPPSLDDIAWAVANVGGPIATLDPPGESTLEEVRALGVAMTIIPVAGLEAAINATAAVYEAIRRDGSAETYFRRNPKRIEAGLPMMKLLGSDEHLARDDAAKGLRSGWQETRSGTSDR